MLNIATIQQKWFPGNKYKVYDRLQKVQDHWVQWWCHCITTYAMQYSWEWNKRQGLCGLNKSQNFTFKVWNSHDIQWKCQQWRKSNEIWNLGQTSKFLEWSAYHSCCTIIHYSSYSEVFTYEKSWNFVFLEVEEPWLGNEMVLSCNRAWLQPSLQNQMN